MKTLFKSFILIAGFFLMVQSAHAGLFGWTTTITASAPGGSLDFTTVTGPTFPSCEFKRQQAINNFIAAGYTIVSDPHCSPIILTIPRELIIPELVRWPLPWPWPGPVCLSCPYLDLENLKEIYPRDHERVRGLMQEYGIDTYNKELLMLQKQFDLEGFEKEMFDLEGSMQLEKR